MDAAFTAGLIVDPGVVFPTPLWWLAIMVIFMCVCLPYKSERASARRSYLVHLVIVRR